MRKTLSCAAMAMMIALAWNANGAPAVQEKTPPKKTATKKKATPARKSAAASSSKKGTGTVKPVRQSWYSQTGYRHGVRAQARDHHPERVHAGQEGARQTRHLAQPANGALARSLPRDSGSAGIQRFPESGRRYGNVEPGVLGCVEEVPVRAESGIHRQDQLAVPDRFGIGAEARDRVRGASQAGAAASASPGQ